MWETSGRLLKLLSLLQARRDWSGGALADRLDVSRRTVRRDVERLRALGYAVRSIRGPDGGYRLDAGKDLPPLLFDDEQALAVVVALQTVAGGVRGIEEAAVRALATVRQVMPARLRHRVDALDVTAVSTRSEGPQVDADALLTIGTACRSSELLRFDYRAGDGTESIRRTEPHRLLSWGRRWYLVAWDRDRDDWRTFRVDRMRPRTPIGPRFAPRPLPHDDIAQYLVESFGRMSWPCRARVVMHAPASWVSPWVRADQGVVEPRDDASCVLEAGSWSWGALAAWLGLFDVDFEVAGPPELSAALADVADRFRHAIDTPR